MTQTLLSGPASPALQSTTPDVGALRELMGIPSSVDTGAVRGALALLGPTVDIVLRDTLLRRDAVAMFELAGDAPQYARVREYLRARIEWSTSGQLVHERTLRAVEAARRPGHRLNGVLDVYADLIWQGAPRHDESVRALAQQLPPRCDDLVSWCFDGPTVRAPEFFTDRAVALEIVPLVREVMGAEHVVPLPELLLGDVWMWVSESADEEDAWRSPFDSDDDEDGAYALDSAAVCRVVTDMILAAGGRPAEVQDALALLAEVLPGRS